MCSSDLQASRSPRYHLDAASTATAWSRKREDDVTTSSTVDPLCEAAPIVVASPLVQHRGGSATRQSTAELHRHTVADDTVAKPRTSEEVTAPRTVAGSEVQPILSPPPSLPFAKSPSPPTLSPLPVTAPSPSAVTYIPPFPPTASFSPSGLDSIELEAVPDVLQVRSFALP